MTPLSFGAHAPEPPPLSVIWIAGPDKRVCVILRLRQDHASDPREPLNALARETLEICCGWPLWVLHHGPRALWCVASKFAGRMCGAVLGVGGREICLSRC